MPPLFSTRMTRRAWLKGMLTSVAFVAPAFGAVPDPARWRGRGSASRLRGAGNLLFLFVSDVGAAPWTPALRNPVTWKIDAALRWLETQAASRGRDLRLRHICLPLDAAAFTASVKVDEGDYRGGPHHAAWQAELLRRLVQPPSADGGVSTLWADLFGQAGLPLGADDHSAVFFMIRRYVPSVAFPCSEEDSAEFQCERGIIYDNGGRGMQRFLDSLVAHELLHLYGAVDLEPGKTPTALEPFRSHLDPDDIMWRPTQHPLGAYRVSDLTAWLVGWREHPPVWLVP